MDVTFTILLPVHRPPALMPYAIGSVLAQRRQDFELIIICDGAPEATIEHAREAARRDARIQVRAHPKGERNGEAWRHEALKDAKGKLVCQIADDDLWLPNHLDEIENLLREFEFGNVPQVEVFHDGQMEVQLGNLAQPRTRAQMASQLFNFFGPSVAGYRLSTYRRLPVGWSPAPADTWSDLHMWRKFLALPDIKCGTRMAFTNLHFHASQRKDWPLERREREARAWAARARHPQLSDQMFQRFLRNMMDRQLVENARRRAASAESPPKP